jgi:hypothetical protein
MNIELKLASEEKVLQPIFWVLPFFQGAMFENGT